MSARFWICLAALFGGSAVVAGTIGAHVLPGAESLSVPVRIFETGQRYQALHALALLGVALAIMTTEGRRTAWAGWSLQVAAAGFAIGIVCFSGGIYVEVARGFTSSGGIVPFGGSCLIAGWLALAIAAIGLRP